MLSKGNVLVVDDEINLCRILSAKLVKDGYEVVAVHDGEQAVEKVRQSHFDVALLDLILPKMDGLSALESIRSIDKDLPVIIMTACENSEAIEQAMNMGVSAYINKPFDLDNVLAIVRNASKTEQRPRVEPRPADATALFVKQQPITMEVFNGSASGHYLSRIEDKDDRTITVLTPITNGEELNVPPRTLVRVGLAVRDAFYSFSSSTLSQRKGKPSVTVLDKPIVIYRTQRRQFARILARVPVKYCPVNDQSDVGTTRNSGWKTGVSHDFSAGGARISVAEQLPVGSLVYIESSPIGNAGPVKMAAKVVRCVAEDTGDRYPYSLGLQFSRVNSNLRGLC